MRREVLAVSSSSHAAVALSGACEALRDEKLEESWRLLVEAAKNLEAFFDPDYLLDRPALSVPALLQQVSDAAEVGMRQWNGNARVMQRLSDWTKDAIRFLYACEDPVFLLTKQLPDVDIIIQSLEDFRTCNAHLCNSFGLLEEPARLFERYGDGRILKLKAEDIEYKDPKMSEAFIERVIKTLRVCKQELAERVQSAPLDALIAAAQRLSLYISDAPPVATHSISASAYHASPSFTISPVGEGSG